MAGTQVLVAGANSTLKVSGSARTDVTVDIHLNSASKGMMIQDIKFKAIYGLHTKFFVDARCQTSVLTF